MEYKGLNIIEKGNGIIVEGIKDFNPVHIFECGQCFRWFRQDDGSYTGIARGRVVNVRCSDGRLGIENTTPEDFKDIWFEYFDLGRDYSYIKQRLANDKILKKAIQFGYGIRILKQDIGETLISFIISANNRIPMIMKVVAAISKVYGEEVQFNGRSYYAFPDMNRLSNSTLEQLEVCKGGFRCKYIIKTSGMIRDNEVNLERLTHMSTEAARSELTRLPGVGDKVADCTLLYSGIKLNVFPTDVWVKRVMEELFFKREASHEEIQNFAQERFGELAGVAQQYLFYYARENKIGLG